MQPPASPRTIQEDNWGEAPATAWDLPEPELEWNFPEEDAEDLVQQEQDISRAGTPDMPQFEAPQADDWGTVPFPNFTWDDNGEQASIASSHRSRTPDIATYQDMTPIDNPAFPSGTSGDVLTHMARDLLLAISAQYSAPLEQSHEDEALVNTSSAIMQPELAPQLASELSLGSAPESAPDVVNLEADEDPQHSSQTSGEDFLGQERVSDDQLSDRQNKSEEPAQSNHANEDTSEHKDLEQLSSTSKQSIRDSHLQTRLSPRRLLRVLRKAGRSALRRKGHTSSCEDPIIVE